MLLSLYSGCGGLDLGFELAGFQTGLAYDIRPHSINSWNRNRPRNKVGHVRDIRELSLAQLDKDFGKRFCPTGVIGGPPCQSFTNANSHKKADDPRESLLPRFFEFALEIHRRSSLNFIVMENVPEVANSRYSHILTEQIAMLEDHGFVCRYVVLNAQNFGVPQSRKRLILVALNKSAFGGAEWIEPQAKQSIPKVRDAIAGLPEAVFFKRGLAPEEIAHHPNHWCMVPKSRKFTDGSLRPGKGFGRSFKMLDWAKPSFTVSYGHREVHVHPDGHRRLSIFEAMLLQGFPKSYVLVGNLSEQITQVSEAVPPPLAKAIAQSIAVMQGFAKPRRSSRSVPDESLSRLGVAA
jgi:DNA (cytosine-5)-methyltransferase 1